jgi:hypothetical protein
VRVLKPFGIWMWCCRCRSRLLPLNEVRAPATTVGVVVGGMTVLPMMSGVSVVGDMWWLLLGVCGSVLFMPGLGAHARIKWGEASSVGRGTT